jgi:hypothetical protein
VSGLVNGRSLVKTDVVTSTVPEMQNDATAQTSFGRSEQKRYTILQSAEEPRDANHR